MIPAYTETFQNDNGTATVNLGSKGVIPSNAEARVLYNKTDPCGTFELTNTPSAGDGYLIGGWSASHIYANAASVPSTVCAVTYDLGPGKSAPTPARVEARAGRQLRVVVALQHRDLVADQGNPACVTLSMPTPAPPPTPTTAALIKSSTPHPATAPAKVLAFTGNGPIDDALGVLGAILVIIGILHVLLRD